MSFSVTLNPVSGRLPEFPDLPRKTVKNGGSLGDVGIPKTCRYWQRTASKERRIPQKECRSTKRHSSAYTRCHLTCLIFTRRLKTWVPFSLRGTIKCNITSYNVQSVAVIIVSQLVFMEICISFSNINISVYCNILYSCIFNVVDRDSSVGIATRYELDDQGIESLWRWNFPNPSTLALGPNLFSIKWVQGLLPGRRAAGAWGWPPTNL
jgi:hypothetical protein